MADTQQLSVEIQGVAELKRYLKSVGLTLRDTKDAMSEVGKQMTKFFSGEVFASRGGVIGERWPALSSAYAAYKAKKWPGRPPMVASGLLQRSFRYKAGSVSVTIDNTAQHFPYHQSSAVRRRLPRRVLMKLDAKRADDARRIIAVNLANKIRAKARGR